MISENESGVFTPHSKAGFARIVKVDLYRSIPAIISLNVPAALIWTSREGVFVDAIDLKTTCP
jgi:hypothetical protein